MKSCVVVLILAAAGVALAKLDSPAEDRYQPYQLQIEAPTPLQRPLTLHEVHKVQDRVKRGAAYAGGHGDFSGVAKQSTFAALGSYGGFLGHGSKGSTAGGYNAGSGRNGYGGAGGITISGALGSYGGYLGHHGPTVLSSGGFGHGGLLFNKI